MKESKEAKFSPNVAPKAATSYYIQIETLLKQPKKFQDNWDIIAGKSCHQYLLKIAQSGHTIHKLHLTHVAVACDSCVSSVIGNFIIFHTVTVSCCHLCLMQLVSSADWAIYWTLGKFLKPLATNILPRSPTFLGNLCKGVKIDHFSSEIIFGELLGNIWRFFLVTLIVSKLFITNCGKGAP